MSGGAVPRGAMATQSSWSHGSSWPHRVPERGACPVEWMSAAQAAPRQGVPNSDTPLPSADQCGPRGDLGSCRGGAQGASRRTPEPVFLLPRPRGAGRQGGAAPGFVDGPSAGVWGSQPWGAAVGGELHVRALPVLPTGAWAPLTEEGTGLHTWDLSPGPPHRLRPSAERPVSLQRTQTPSTCCWR